MGAFGPERSTTLEPIEDIVVGTVPVDHAAESGVPSHILDAAGPFRLVAPTAVLREIRAHAEATYPEECCGALVGRVAGGGAVELVRSVAVENHSAGSRATAYLIPASVVREVESTATGEGLELIGFYHSHPDGPAEPSARDRESAWPWYSYLIVPVDAGRAGGVRAWRLRGDRSGFHAMGLRVPSCEEGE